MAGAQEDGVLLAGLHQDVALLEMTDRKFMSDDGSVQSCTYAGGLTVPCCLP
jgi:hypothetical protein